jgi:hypothetical protein
MGRGRMDASPVMPSTGRQNLMKFLFLHLSFHLESLCAEAYPKAVIASKK